ncbi:MAG: HAD family hydrolase [Chloroflexi bacterium]|nr:HAD family hydrolase [Chloroflexota bacterium]
MLDVTVPGLGQYRLDHLVLDVNGTLACDGALLPGVAKRLAALRTTLDIHLLSADTHGGLSRIAETLQVPAVRLKADESEVEQKAVFVRRLEPSRVVAIGNGANDVGMLREAALGIAVLGPEGLAIDALGAADILVGSIADGLDLLIRPRRLVATLRR